VPAGAETATCRIRSNVNRTVWIDAVCINQGDLEERAQQVPFIGRVYSKGYHTIVRLGKGPERLKAADTVFRDFNHETAEWRNFRDSIASAPLIVIPANFSGNIC
jgi:Heterokaryon incompatibility protein (HET)